MSDKFEELESLLFDWEAAKLDEPGLRRLREILVADPDARAHYVRMRMIDTALRLDGDAGLATPLIGTQTPADESASRAVPSTKAPSTAGSLRSRRGFRGNFWLTGALSLAVCVLAGWLVVLYFPSQVEEQGRVADGGGKSQVRTTEATSVGLALVTRLVGIEWGRDQRALEVGDALMPGRLAIESGYVQIEFFCGATVVLEGPAELDLQSAMLAKVLRGRLRAQVPPAARGFSLEVDGMKVVDLGTEFGLSVSSQGADLQVFDGQVELHRPADEKQLLKAGDAVIRTPAGAFRKSEVTPANFVDIAKLESRVLNQRADRVRRWKAWSEKVRRDDRLIAYYAFDQAGPWQRRLKNSLASDQRDLDGAIVGARRVRGRWPSKSALEFKRPGDRVRVFIPGEYRSLTFSCWVKIDSLDRWYNSLFLTDNYNQGEPHWQILDTGQLFFSVRPRPDGVRGEQFRGPPHREVVSPPFWKPSMSGKWLHLATTYDVDARQTTHYLNGEEFHREKIPELQLVKVTRIGAASLGNWSAPTRPDARFAIRNLNGSIDEFALFSAALTAVEIREIYDNGKP